MRIDIKELNGWHAIPHTYIADKRLSIEAIGLITKLYCLPDEWEFSMDGLCHAFKIGITKLRRIINEIEMFGYLSRIEVRENGKINYVWKMHIEPKKATLKNTLSYRIAPNAKEYRL